MALTNKKKDDDDSAVPIILLFSAVVVSGIILWKMSEPTKITITPSEILPPDEGPPTEPEPIPEEPPTEPEPTITPEITLAFEDIRFDD